MKKKLSETGEEIVIDEPEVKREEPKRDKTLEYLLSLPDSQYLAYIQKVNTAREAAARAKKLRRRK